jgi:soluble lytic murein transglycosylase-like protein
MRAPLLFMGLALVGCINSQPPRSPRPARAERPVPARLAQAQRVQAVRYLVRNAAHRHRVREDLVLAVIHVESRFHPNVCSPAGACGLMQLMPRTARTMARQLGYGEHDVFDPAFNINAGTAFLAQLLRRFRGNKVWALASYNAGPMRVRNWRRRKRGLSKGVRRYVANVLAAQKRFARRPGGRRLAARGTPTSRAN